MAVLLAPYSRRVAPEPPVEPPATGSFAELRDLHYAIGSLFGYYDFDSQDSVGGYPGDPTIPIRYVWNGADSALNTAMAGFANHTLTTARSAGQGNTLVYTQPGGIVRPMVDNTVYHADGGGTGALKIVRVSQSDQGSAGYFSLPIRGLLGSPQWVGPDHGNHGALHLRFRYRTENMNQDFGDPGVYEAHKVLFLFGDPPGGGNSNPFELTVMTYTSKEHILGHYTRNLTSFEPFERNLGSGLLMQDASLCPYAGAFISYDVDGGLYDSPPCGRLIDDYWHEILMEVRLRPADYSCTLSGTTLTTSTAVFSAGMVNRHIYLDQFSGLGRKGFARISAYTGPTQVTIADLDSSLSDGSGLALYISAYPNSYIQTWLNGVRMFRWPRSSFHWRRPTSTDGDGRGFGQFQNQNHSTSKNNTKVHAQATAWWDDQIFTTQPIESDFVPNKMKAAGVALAAGAMVKMTGLENFYPGPEGPDSTAENATSGVNVFGQKGTNDKSYLEFTHNGEWDPVGERILKLGASDGAPASTQNRFLAFNARANSFSYLKLPEAGPTAGFLGHDYAHSSLDSVNQVWYRRLYNSNRVLRMDLKTGTQTTLPVVSGLTTSVTSICWFPERGTEGRLLMFSGQDNFLIEWDPTNPTVWTTIHGSGLTTSGAYHNFFVHCSVNECVYFGGGNIGASPFFPTDSFRVYTLGASDSSATALTNCPVKLGMHPECGILTTCPTSGKLLAFSSDGHYEFDPSEGLDSEWSSFSVASPNIFEESGWSSTISMFSITSTPITSPDYGGVIAFWKHFRTDDRAWFYLYKHEAA